MRPTEGELHWGGFSERAITGVAVDLHSAAKAFEVGDGTLGLAIGRVHVSDGRRRWSAPRPIITGIGPELASLGSAAAGIEHRRGGLIGEELG